MDPVGRSLSRKRSASRVVAFIVARLSSSRLPAKQLRTIGDRRLIDWTVAELQRCRRLDQVVVATASEPENEPLRDYCRERGLECFWFQGDVNHVTTRLRRAAEHYRADIGVLVSGDCPLLQAEAIDDLIAAFESAGEAAFVQIAGQTGAPALQGLVMARTTAWQLADDLADRPELKEHQFPLLGRRPDLFPVLRVELPEEYCMSYHRLSVDTAADLEFMNALWSRLRDAGREFNLREAVRLLKQSPELRAINAHVHQRGVEEQARSVLCIADAGGSYGFGHLARSTELALQIVERLSWPVRFVVDDREALERLQRLGFVCFWGAFGRPSRPSPRSVLVFDGRLDDADLVVLDIFDQRGPEPGWRASHAVAGKVAVIENWREWSLEADLIVGPNVLGRGNVSAAAGPRVIDGADCLILRREIRREAALETGRETDLLVYLHDPRQREEVGAWARGAGVRADLPDAYALDFPRRLAGSRVYLSGFGVSFYEALALGSVPVCWPDSRAHREDAERFYEWWGVSPLIVESGAELDRVFRRARDLAGGPLPRIDDGTPAIVDELKRLVESS